MLLDSRLRGNDKEKSGNDKEKSGYDEERSGYDEERSGKPSCPVGRHEGMKIGDNQMPASFNKGVIKSIFVLMTKRKRV